MIRYEHILDAVNNVNGWREGIESSPLVKHLTQVLEEYKNRGEFQGDMQSAIDCLQDSAFEIEPGVFEHFKSKRIVE